MSSPSSESSESDCSDYSYFTYYTSKELLDMFTNGNREDIVTFTFPDSKANIQSLKSLLAKVSPVFEAMFSGQWKEENVVKLDDPPQINPQQTFNHFIRFIHGTLKTLKDLPLLSLLHVHYYAEKYDVKDVRKEIYSAIRSQDKINMIAFKECLEAAVSLNLSKFVDKIDRDLQIVTGGDVIEWFNMCEKYNLKFTMEKIVAKVCYKPFNEEWPSKLKELVHEKNCLDRWSHRKGIERLKELKSRLHCQCAGQVVPLVTCRTCTYRLVRAIDAYDDEVGPSDDEVDPTANIGEPFIPTLPLVFN